LGFDDDSTTEVTDVKRSWLGSGWRIVGLAASVALLAFIGIHQSDIMPGAPRVGSEMQAPAISTTTTKPDLQEPSPSLEPIELAEETAHYAVYETMNEEDAVIEKPKLAVNEIKAPSPVATPSDEGKTDVVMFQKAQTDVTIEVVTEAERIIKDELELPADTTSIVAGAADEVTLGDVSIDGLASLKPGRISRIDRFDIFQPDAVAKVEDDETSDTTVDTGEIFIRGDRAGEVGYITDGPRFGGPLSGFGYSNLRLVEGDTLGIEHWREVRDSLKAQLKARTDIRSSAPSKSGRRQASQAPSIPEPEEQSLENRRGYLEAVYMVAKLTDDTDEYHELLNILSAYLEEFEAPLRDVVKGYIKDLED
jgi:hypothetical protein